MGPFPKEKNLIIIATKTIKYKISLTLETGSSYFIVLSREMLCF
jgi:hypothetical protein